MINESVLGVMQELGFDQPVTEEELRGMVDQIHESLWRSKADWKRDTEDIPDEDPDYRKREEDVQKVMKKSAKAELPQVGKAHLDMAWKTILRPDYLSKVISSRPGQGRVLKSSYRWIIGRIQNNISDIDTDQQPVTQGTGIDI